MASVNKFIGIGNLGRDPETRYMPNGDAVTNISIACTESWVDKATREKKEATEWVRITFYRKLAEIAGQYLKKGSSIYIEGKLQTRKWTDKDGVERYTTEVIADVMKMLGGGPKQQDEDSAYGPYVNDAEPAPQGSRSRASSARPAPANNRPAPNFSDMDDDIPF